MTGCIQIVTLTATRAEADHIAARLVEDRLAACVQIVGPASSIYRWQDRLERGEEWICLIKTVAERFAGVAAIIRELHSYQLPEIIAMPIMAGSPEYLGLVGGRKRWSARPANPLTRSDEAAGTVILPCGSLSNC